MATDMNVLVIGTGAIGGFYGSLLARAGAKVSVVARSDYAAVAAHGITVESKQFGDYHFQPAAVVRDASELKDKPDYVLLCVKHVAGVDSVALVKNALGANTAIVLIANGVDVERDLAAAYPSHEIISGLAFVCVSRTAAGQIWHQDYGRLVLGNYPRGVSAKTKALCALFEKTGISCVASDNVVTARWEKCVWNAPFNPLSVLSGGLTTDAILAIEEPFVRVIMEEVAAIAAALGHPLPADAVATRLAYSHKMVAYKTSMLLDFEAGRPMETEVILGAAVRAGRQAGVPIPHLESLYAVMKLRELKISEGHTR